MEVGVLFPDVEGGSPVSRCGRWDLCCHSDKVGGFFARRIVGGWKFPSGPEITNFAYTSFATSINFFLGHNNGAHVIAPL